MVARDWNDRVHPLGLRHRLVACVAVGLAFHAALAPVALASTMPPGFGATRSAPAKAAAPPPRTDGPARPDDAVPELWAPRAATLVDGNQARGAESLFDGDARTGFTTQAGGAGSVRLDLGSAREVLGLGVHGSGRAKVTIYAEDAGARRLISTGGDGAVNLQPDHWAQVTPAPSTKTAALVVEWTVPPGASTTVTELALWVSGRSRQALSEAAIADRLVTELPENAVAARAVPGTASVARFTPQGPVSASFTVKLNAEPRLGRAFLVYELDKKAHWTGVARAINGHVVRGGYRAEAKGLGGVQVEEINPAWLMNGDNKILFESTLTEDPHGYNISSVRVVTVPRGADGPPAPGARSPLSDGDVATGVGGPGAHAASVSMRADREPAFLSFYLDKPTSGTLTASTDGGGSGRKGQVEVDLKGRPAGWQTVPVAGVLPASSELRVRVVGDKESTAQVGEARILGFPALMSDVSLAVSYPLHGECSDHKTYVRGFVSGPGRLQKPKLILDGQPATGKIDPDGSFEVDVKEPATAKGKPWSIRLEVATEDGGRLARTVPVDSCVEPPKKRILGVSPPVEDVGAPYGAVVSPQKASTLDFAGATIEIPAGAVDSDVRVTMRALDGKHVQSVTAEMDNVTTSGGALRFGPHGLRFKKPVKVTLPIDGARLPQGMTSGDVAAFFFNEANGKWTELPKVLSRADRVVGETTHFTDFIASTVKMPEHPDAQQFNPNTMKGVKVGEPGAGVTLIEPPQVNSRGSASLSYPIETPPARNGIGPSLALTYDSERVNSNGWVGVGWHLSGLSVIEIDSRFGVPNYDAQDIYSLDGQMLTSTGTSGQYKKRVEGSFDLIERRGPTGSVGSGDAKTYYWTVTDKNGTVYTYGSANTNCGTLTTPAVCNSRLANPRPGTTELGRIFRWHLERVQDAYGNFMTITYKHDAFVMTGSSPAETADAVYPYMIDYTARTGLAANYHVEFKLDTTPGTGTAGTRPDITSSARGGFVELTQRRLTDIFVRSGTTATPSPVRHYKLYYEQNAQDLTDRMQKSVLSAVALWSSETDQTTELYRHTFEYNKIPAAVAGKVPMFATDVKTWGQVSQSDNGLGHYNDNLAGGAITLGVGFPYVSVSGSFGMDTGNSVTDLAFLGLTGQGLPDQVGTNGVLSQNNLLASPNYFSPTTTNLTGLGTTDHSGWTAGGSVSALGGAFGGGVSYARHVQDDGSIVTDMNGDGFPDLAYANGGTINAYINDGNRNFTAKTWTGYDLSNSQFSTVNRMDASITASNFRTDPLIRWVAPYDGDITITIKAIAYQLAATRPGASVALELYLPNEAVRSVTVTLPDPFEKILAAGYVKTVKAGDKIFLRAVGTNLDQNNAMVNWYSTTPDGWTEWMIKYTPPTDGSRQEGPNGRNMYSYDPVLDYRLSGGPAMPWHLTGNGNVGVARCFSKQQTADEVTVSYVLRDKNGNPANPVSANPVRWDLKTPPAAGTYCFPSTSAFLQSSDANMAMINGTANPGVKQDYSLGLEFTSDSPVDFGQDGQFQSSYAISPVIPDNGNGHMMSYTSYCRNSACGAPSPLGSGYTVPGDLFAAKFPIPGADIMHDWPGAYRQARVWRNYRNGNTTVAKPSAGIPVTSSSLTFGGTITTPAGGPLADDVLVLIQGVNELHAKRFIPKGTAANTAFSVPGTACTANSHCETGQTCTGTTPNKQCTGPITPGAFDATFFTVYSPTLSVAQSMANNWSPTINGAALTTAQRASINLATRDVTFDNNLPTSGSSRDPMAGGFHNWFYGDWNDSVTPFCDNMASGCANPIVRTTAMPQNNDAVMLGVPQPGPLANTTWYGRGGSSIHTMGGATIFMNPGRSSPPNATATNASAMTALRVADTWNFNLNTNVGAFTAGLNVGDATTQVEFLDFNGDRAPDSITRGGVLINNGKDGFVGSRRGLDWTTRAGNGDSSGEIRKILNASLQAGVTVTTGGRQLINEAKGNGETQKISTTASVSGSADYGVSSTRIDFADVNGDGLVDHVRQEPGYNGLKVRLNLGYGFANEVTWNTTEWSQNAEASLTDWADLGRLIPQAGATTSYILNHIPLLTDMPASTDVVRLQDTGTLSAVVGGGYGPIGGGGGPSYSVTRTWSDLMDVNGDGLPDQVLKVPGENVLRVKLNKGDRFDAAQQWTMPSTWPNSPAGVFSFLKPDGLAFSAIDGWSKNFSFQVCWILCVGGSGFGSDSSGGPTVQFEDIDGDGDLDQVMKVPGDQNVYAKINNVVNSDGTDATKLGAPNLLRAVNRPFKGRFEISYARAGNRVDMLGSFGGPVNMPSNQWVMSGVVLNSDSRTACPTAPPMTENCSRQKFEYKAPWSGKVEGFYDPVEREHYGYFTTTTIFPDEDVGGTSIESTYQSHNYYKRGLETTKYWYQNATTRVAVRALTNSYADPSGVDPSTLLERTGSYFPAPTGTTTFFYEMVGANKSQTIARIFDAKGDLTDFIDTGDDDFDNLDDFNYHVDYKTIGTTIKVPQTITIRSGNVAGQGTMLAQRTSSFGTKPKPDWIEDEIIGGKDPTTGLDRTTTSPGHAKTTFAYDAYGNLTTVTSPNAPAGSTDPDGNARQLSYTYDAATRTYRESAKWSPDGTNYYTSTATYEPKFGLPKSITDVAGARQEIDYDNYGRMTKVFAPNDFNTSGGRIDTNAPTIAVTYGQVAQAAGGAESVPEWAMVTHRTRVPGELSYPGDTISTTPIRTVNFIDGLNRSIQVKKDISRDDGTTTTLVMSVSGKTVFDPRGRVYQQGLPSYDGPNTPNTFVAVGMTDPSTYAYDVLGRLRKEEHPDSANGMTATTKISYQAGTSPLNGRNYIVKMTTDPAYDWDTNYHYRAEYRNVRDQVELLLEPNAINGAVTNLYTQYFYDLLGRVKKVQDARSNNTFATWDSVGHLVKLQSPDAGNSSTAPREWRYCLGGYMCTEKPPRGTSTQLIKYSYDRDRLSRIDYPNIPAASGAPADPVGNPSVVFTYGSALATDKGTISLAGGANYKANRITRRVDEAGQFDFDYDALGNVISETALLKKTSSTNYQSYRTKYQWDNFGRLVDVTIPGTTSPSTPEEIIRYGYDAGGAVASARGKLTTAAATTFDYVNHVGYNEFGERVRIAYGNGAVSTYGYYPDTRRLASATTNIQDNVAPPARAIQQLYFYYDVLGNVSSRYQALGTDDDPTHAVRAGGYSQQWYGYDPLNQLTAASLYTQRTSIADDYANVSIDYDEIGNITGKVQTQGGDYSDGQGNWYSYTGGDKQYTLTPHYDGTAFNPSPHAPSTIDVDRDWMFSTRVLTYDKNGNVEKQVHDTVERRIRWTDGDRIRSICEGVPGGTCSQITEARYDADGTRTHNKVYSVGTSNTETLYLNQYLTVRNGTLPTKHVYLGDARVASKVESDSSSTGNNTYWYHSDHLQSTQYVTTKGPAGGPPARVTQYLEFFPGGEIFYEETGQPSTMLDIAHATTFTGKELDQKTGYYYYGARYYEPTMQMWMSPDPILPKYMRGGGNTPGVFAPKNLGLYSYSWNNPVVLKDPDGRDVIISIGPNVAGNHFNSVGDQLVKDLKAKGIAGDRIHVARLSEGGTIAAAVAAVEKTGRKVSAGVHVGHGSDGTVATNGSMPFDASTDLSAFGGMTHVAKGGVAVALSCDTGNPGNTRDQEKLTDQGVGVAAFSGLIGFGDDGKLRMPAGSKNVVSPGDAVPPVSKTPEGHKSVSEIIAGAEQRVNPPAAAKPSAPAAPKPK